LAHYGRYNRWRLSERFLINFNDLNVFVGKNDIGKYTILEALDIFLDKNKVQRRY